MNYFSKSILSTVASAMMIMTAGPLFAQEGESNGMPAGRFGWNELVTTDVAAAKKFYSEVFGWKSKDWEGESSYVFFEGEDGSQIAGAMNIEGADGGSPHWFSYITVDDVSGTCEKIKSAGGKVLREPFDIKDKDGKVMVQMAIVQDPQGAVFGISKYFAAPAS